MAVRVQTEDFDVGAEYQQLIGDNPTDGAVVFFVGLVRDMNQGDAVSGLLLEHYPGMTERALHQIEDDACARWPLGRVQIVHRVGQLGISDQIVFVGTSSPHREAAFEACQFMMDYLKNHAPFWKKETLHQSETNTRERWLDAAEKDLKAEARWG
ncbi:molybdopterin synthase catalytic subunit MoaE [Oceanobacter antarcticus]|uniref:Molybdopterin synthase catalytic subunit n=1 Tax=Oceanobacter antarcticus TaxID=3133425 RepID=A0ABW8NPX5_9GAMM